MLNLFALKLKTFRYAQNNYKSSLYARYCSHIDFAIWSLFSDASSHSITVTSTVKSSHRCWGDAHSTSARLISSPSSGSYAQMKLCSVQMAFTSLACFSSEYSGAATMIQNHRFTTPNIHSIMFRACEWRRLNSSLKFLGLWIMISGMKKAAPLHSLLWSLAPLFKVVSFPMVWNK